MPELDGENRERKVSFKDYSRRGLKCKMLEFVLKPLYLNYSKIKQKNE